MIIYGIKNCDTVKKSIQWLKSNNIEFEFHDYKTKGISEAKLKDWVKQVGWESLVNKKGTTWKQLDDSLKTGINETSAIGIMRDHTSVIKRPVVEKNGKILCVGFDEEKYKSLFV